MFTVSILLHPMRSSSPPRPRITSINVVIRYALHLLRRSVERICTREKLRVSPVQCLLMEQTWKWVLIGKSKTQHSILRYILNIYVQFTSNICVLRYVSGRNSVRFLGLRLFLSPCWENTVHTPRTTSSHLHWVRIECMITVFLYAYELGVVVALVSP